MNTYVVNAYIKKGSQKTRRNFNIQSESDDESSLTSEILAKVATKQDEWEFKEDKFKLIEKESVIIYEIEFTKK